MRLISVLMFCLASVWLTADILSVESLPADTLTLTPTGKFNMEMINESSALVQSRQYEGLFWTLNDSGDEARIFPVESNGDVVAPEWVDDYTGVHIPDAVNIDWEDIAVDDSGNLIIGACGNNANMRRDLALYFIREPHPLATTITRVWKRIDFHYPEQTSFPPELSNFDCEAVFWAHNHVYLLTKHRSDPHTVLYRLDTLDPMADNPATKLAEFDIRGAVTAADCSPDGTKLAVLTYTNVWVFEQSEGDNWFEGDIYYRPIKAQQCEAICWDGDKLIITNEQMDLFEMTMDQLHKVK